MEDRYCDGCGNHIEKDGCVCDYIENNKPHLCVPTLDGNVHVIPAEVFDKIVSGEMKITDMDDWEIITRTAFSEWLRGLETQRGGTWK